jgi:hypothetical protein
MFCGTYYLAVDSFRLILKSDLLGVLSMPLIDPLLVMFAIWELDMSLLFPP